MLAVVEPGTESIGTGKLLWVGNVETGLLTVEGFSVGETVDDESRVKATSVIDEARVDEVATGSADAEVETSNVVCEEGFGRVVEIVDTCTLGDGPGTC